MQKYKFPRTLCKGFLYNGTSDQRYQYIRITISVFHQNHVYSLQMIQNMMNGRKAFGYYAKFFISTEPLPIRISTVASLIDLFVAIKTSVVDRSLIYGFPSNQLIHILKKSHLSTVAKCGCNNLVIFFLICTRYGKNWDKHTK